MSLRLVFSMIALFGVVAVVGADLVEREGKMFMRQSLSFKHKSLEKECGKCHVPWKGVLSSQCKSCHQIQTHIKDTAKTKEKDCLECHREHKGSSASLIAITDEYCMECHQKGGPGPWPHNPIRKNARSGVLLTHNTHFMRDFYMGNVCKSCHLPGTLRMKDTDMTRPVKDIMFNHISRRNLKCQDCHNPVKVEGFSAHGGGLVPDKCIDCHEKKLVSVSCGYCHKFHHLSDIEMALSNNMTQAQ